MCFATARKLKNKATTLSGPSKWDFEIGQDLLSRSVLDSEGIAENVTNVSFSYFISTVSQSDNLIEEVLDLAASFISPMDSIKTQIYH